MKYDWPVGATKWIKDRTLYASIPFTWNLPDLCSDFMQRDIAYDKIVVGGPAIRLMPEYFAGMNHVSIRSDYPGVLQRINPLATRTTSGCIRSCGFCAVPKTEGAFIELDDWPDLPIVCDNNLLAASQKHFDKVCDRLKKHKWSDFNQGLDARLLDGYHAERLARLPGCIIRLALDHSKTETLWLEAYEKLIAAKFPKSRMRSYVLCGFNSDPADAWKRCELVQGRGVLALPQWYHPLDAMEYMTVLDCHKKYGWNKQEVNRIMGYYYQHRGSKPKVSKESK